MKKFSLKNKTIEALLRGYILFQVNGTFYRTYNAGLEARKSISGKVYFRGLHIFKGWRSFYERIPSAIIFGIHNNQGE